MRNWLNGRRQGDCGRDRHYQIAGIALPLAAQRAPFLPGEFLRSLPAYSNVSAAGRRQATLTAMAESFACEIITSPWALYESKSYVSLGVSWLGSTI
jgi:hypothetical protein